MAVYKRGKKGIYRYDFVRDGKRYQGSTKQRNRRATEDIESKLITALAKGEFDLVQRKPASSFRELKERFLAHVEARHENKPQTIAFYSAKLNQLIKFLPIQEARVDQIDEGVIERYVVFRRDRVGPATVNRELATLRRMLRLAHEWKDLDRVPRIRLLSGERNRDFVLSRSQEKIYLDACPQPLRDVAILILETALRTSEALALKWSDVTLEPLSGSRFGFIRVREGKSKNAKRTIPLSDRAAAMLRGRLKERKYPLVFPNEQGNQYLVTSIDHLHRKVTAPVVEGKRRPLFGPDFVVYSLRHTMLTRLGEAGVDAFTIMRIAGHSSITVSQRYVHPTPENVERAFERLQLSAVEKEAERIGVPAKFPSVQKSVAVSH